MCVDDPVKGVIEMDEQENLKILFSERVIYIYITFYKVIRLVEKFKMK